MANSKLKCLWCKERFPREQMVRTPAGNFCTHDHAIEYANDRREKQAKRQLKKKRTEVRTAKRKLRKGTLSWQHEHTQRAFNKMRVLEEKLWFRQFGIEPACISCGEPLGGDQWCAGHFKSRGAHPELRYDRNNVFLQHNRRCNQQLSGDIEGTKTTHGYKKGLLIRFGKKKGQQIIDYCESHHEPVKWSCVQLEEMRVAFNARIRELQRIIDVADRINS